jgi:SecD/SecF fusion protein
MQGKGVVKFFAIILALVCLYQLSFTWVTRKVESDAKAYANAHAKGDVQKEKVYEAYLDSMSNQPVYPILGHDYQHCKQNELALGLDLQGGMSVTMQISLHDMVKKLANNNPDVVFNQALATADAESRSVASEKDYITLFVQAYQKLNPGGKLASLFATKDNQDNIKFNSSDSEVESFLQSEAKTAVDQSFTVLSNRIDQFGVTSPTIQEQQGTNRILIELPAVKNVDRVRSLLSGTAKLEFYETFENGDAQGNPGEGFQALDAINNAVSKARKDTTKADTTAKATAAVNPAATVASVKTKADSSKNGLSLLSKVQKSTAKDTSKLSPKQQAAAAKNSLFSVLMPSYYQDAQKQIRFEPGPVVGEAQLKDTAKVNALLNSPAAKSVTPHDMKFLWGVKPSTAIKTAKVFELYAIKLSSVNNGPVLQGDVITDARGDVDQKGQPDVVMDMNSAGAQKWAEVTREAAKTRQSVAIVLDNNVYSAPFVDSEIPNGNSTITGNFTAEDVKALASVLNAGRLPAPAVIISDHVVGPSLGQEAINAGLLSCVLGFLVVLIFMIAYYNRAGTVAVVAVVINMFFLIGVLAGINAVLTMPGIAGIILLLGISVDANVLIYERVREELALGKSIRIAVNDGFKHALPSILDSNISTFITGLILLIFGTGPIKGFATTLMIGIVTSLFCSLLISRVIFDWMITKGWDIKFSNPWSSHTFKNANYAFVKNRFKFYIFSGSFILIGIISMATRGFNYGVDFEGGRNYIVRFENKSVTTQDVHDAVDPSVLGRSTEVKTFGSDISITTSYLRNDNSTGAEDSVRTALITALNTKAKTHVTKASILSGEKVSPTIAGELKKSAVWTVLFAIIIISAYILIRFRKWQFSLGAMIATAHDALMVLSFFTLFKDVLPFSLDIDQAFIAAILTVIGYSINDTVVVFDRIREFLDLHHAKTDDPKEVINHAINNTLSRTIITALTVLFVLIVLFIFGGDVIRGFSFALLIGVCFGTYSSICIATPVIIDFGKKDLK